MPNAFSTSPTSDGIRRPAGVHAADGAAWNRHNRGGGPFTDHRFLAALETAGCIGPGTGWTPQPLLHVDGACVPLYRKDHSHGEFVFDWAWARASEGAGLSWYPKLLVAAPYTPVTGPRILGADTHPAAAAELIGEIQAMVEREGLSSAGVNFCDETDAQLLKQAGWLARKDWQYHWTNPDYRDFDDFLDRLKRKPRKNIRRERRLAREAGWTFEWLDGESLDEAALDFVHACYEITFLRYGNLPALTRTFFGEMARTFGEQFLVCLARSETGRPGACAIFWRDDTRLYGRYWGSREDVRDVHFEACYYQGIEYCIREGLEIFEPGAQGEHKIRRGFLPVATRSFHYIRHPGLRRAIANWLAMETRALDDYRRQLRRLNPFST